MSEPFPKRQKRTIEIEIPDDAIVIEKLPDKSNTLLGVTAYYEVKGCELICYMRQNYQLEYPNPEDVWEDMLGELVEDIVDDIDFELDMKKFKPATMVMGNVVLISSTTRLFPFHELKNLSFTCVVFPLKKL